MNNTNELTQEKLKAVIDYNPITGVFKRKNQSTNPDMWKVEQSKNSLGYARICILGKYRSAHRMAWLYVYGVIPRNQIDHINRNKTDNRIENLREVTQSENNQNTGICSRNTSGVRGVTWHQKIRKWQTVIGVNGRNIYLGCFEKISDAQLAYAKAAEIHHRYNPFSNLERDK